MATRSVRWGNNMQVLRRMVLGDLWRFLEPGYIRTILAAADDCDEETLVELEELCRYHM